MNFDTLQLAAVVDQLNKSILGARIDKVSQPEPLDLVIDTYTEGSHKNLLISADANAARVHLIRQKSRPNPLNAPAFCMLMRKYVDGGFITEITQPLGFSERVARIRIRSNHAETVDLWIEIMGRQSNVILTNESGIILGAIKRVTSDMSRVREIRAGIPYSPPPRQLGYKRDPMNPSSVMGLPMESFVSAPDAEKWLSGTFSGVGSLFAKEVVARCNELPINGEKLWFVLNEVLNLVRNGTYTAVVFKDLAGHVAGAYPFPLKSVSLDRQFAVSTISDALEVAYTSRIEEDTTTRERNALLVALRKSLRVAEKQAVDIQEGLVNAEGSDYLRESGELILANLANIEAGASKIAVDDLFSGEPEAERTILLDSSMTAQENAQRYFRKFQKARDSRETLIARQGTLEKSLVELRDAILLAENAVSANEVASLAERLGSDLQTPQFQSAGKQQEPSPFAGHKIRTYRSPDGWEILVGENSTSNDFLTTKIASPSDIWLHARAVPSAHAVIRAQNRPASVSDAALRLAAEQVARRSTAKHARLVSVDYTLKKYVRKPRGSAPGQVTYTNERTLDVVAQADN